MGKMSLSVYVKGGYEDFHALKAAKKQSQFKANLSFTAEDAEIAELINIISSFSAVLASSAVDLKKQNQSRPWAGNPKH